MILSVADIHKLPELLLLSLGLCPTPRQGHCPWTPGSHHAVRSESPEH